MAVARQMMPSHVERGRFGAGTTGCMGTGFPCKHSAMIPPFSPPRTCCHRRLVLRDGAVCDRVPCTDAVGAKLARPEQQVVAILGDYAFGAACMEVETCIRWNIPVVIVLSNNAGIAAHSIQDRSFSEGAPPVRRSKSLLGFLEA